MLSPALAPAARMSRATATGLSVASAWNVTLYAPASAYGGAQRSGSSIIRWQSIGMSLAANRLSTTGSPSVRFGTKCASITSTCNQSAPSTSAAASASRAKSAASIDGAISGRSALPDMNVTLLGVDLQGRSEHGVGAVAVWPQLNVRAVAQVGHRLEQRPGIQRGHRMPAQRVGDHADRL